MKLKVSSKSNVKKVAGSIAKNIREKYCTEIQVVGASAINQAVKSIAIASRFLKEDKIYLQTKIEFTDIDFGGKIESGILFKLRGAIF